MKNYCLFLPLLIFIILGSTPLSAYNLKQITNNDNLSNSSITNFCQNEKGLMLIGTCDGLNMYNSRDVTVYQPKDEENLLSGNLIDKIVYTGENVYWIQTYYGLNKFDANTNSITYHNEFNRLYFIEKDINNNLFIIKESNSIYYYHKPSSSFQKILISGVIFSDIINVFIDNNTIWIVTNKGYILTYDISQDEETSYIHLSPKKNSFQFPTQLLNCYHEDGYIYIVDSEYNFYTYNIEKDEKLFIYNLSDKVHKRGRISSIIRHHDNFFIGFLVNGLIQLEKKETLEYKIKEIEVESGIFCLKKDLLQDIIWIGTDGKGVYIYSETAYSIKSTILNNISNKIERPVRAIHLDEEQTLWIGSKGDGILKIYDYDENKSIHNSRMESINVTNSALSDNVVYTFGKSSKNILWIGTEEGLNYYSFRDKKVRQINIDINGENFKYIHDIYETDESELWIASVGMGVIKAQVAGTENEPILKNIQQFTINNGDFESNYFFSIYSEDKSTIWFGNRGYGPFKFNPNTQNLDPVNYYDKSINQTINDVFAIQNDSSGNYLFGTSYGLVKYYKSGQYEVFSTNDGFLNNSIHAIQKGGKDTFWMSTNSGIVAFNSEKDVFRIFDKNDGLKVSEFSDGASFRDEKNDIIFFGGINGYISIRKGQGRDSLYMPEISFDYLSIFGNKENIDEKLEKNKDKRTLVLEHKQNFFSISFTAIDYLNGGNYTYFYKLDGLSNQWINNGQSNQASFTNISPGEYTLLVKYHNRSLDQESQIYPLTIKILPPWYKSTLAYIFYYLLLIGLAGTFIYTYIKKDKIKKEKIVNDLEKKHQKEVFESKLRFFTNIAHEFCTPLSLISGPCERILAQPKIDKFVKNYVEMIQSNAERLNNLIIELIEFRRIETGNRNLQVETLPITHIAEEILVLFSDVTESNNISLEFNSEGEIIWNSDKGFLVTIITNLMSNAFKYTPIGKKITVNISVENNSLHIKIANQAFNPINEKDYKLIFDRYTILNDFENQDHNQAFSRNGLGLAISYNMVKLLNGTIEGKNIPDDFVEFTVILPMIETNIESDSKQKNIVYTPVVEQAKPIKLPEYEYDKLRPTVLIIDDEIEMIWFIGEIFSSNYNIITSNDPLQLDNILAEFTPNVIISDVMMPGMTGIELTQKIKSKEETSHIPVILVSGKYEIEQQIEALEAGAEIYITKPFNSEYLKVSVEQVIGRKEKLKDYFSSPISSYELDEGKLMHKEHKKFLQSILKIINSNITNKELSTQFIADKLGMGSRSLYRKMEEMGEESPSHLIKECRLLVAKDLLLKTKMTIDEVVYKSGFSNKVTFFKAFNKKFGCTPKEYRMKHNEDITKDKE
ncbi:response regulator [Bacteroidales bacterium OttesenSCG-928-I14]|nr:response regulator [Bacteroidales bacterium OttesenSCG-928-I14]